MIPGGLMSTCLPAQVSAHTAPFWGQLLQPPSWQPVLLPPLTLAPLMASTLPWTLPRQKSIFCQMVWLPKPWYLLVHTTEMWEGRDVVFRAQVKKWEAPDPSRLSESWAKLSARHMIDGLSLGNTYCIDINADEIQIQKTSMSVFQKLTKPLSRNRLWLTP